MEVIPLPQGSRSVQATCELLEWLLTEDPDYRRRWRSHSSRNSGSLNQAAVAKVLELHLWESGEYSDSVMIARTLKDRVSRAMAGKMLSAETLRWLIEAFDMTPADRDHLWETFSGKGRHESEIANTLRRRREMIKRQCHRTVNLVERYTVDSTGALKSRHTVHTIRAVEDGVDLYIFNHEPQASHVDVVYGGTVGTKYQYGGGLYSSGIELDRSLRKDDRIALEYFTYFERGAVRLTEVRRAAFARVENVDIAVRFEGSTPSEAWWCVWYDQLDGDPVKAEPVEVSKGAVRQFVRSIEETVVGFRWTW